MTYVKDCVVISEAWIRSVVVESSKLPSLTHDFFERLCHRSPTVYMQCASCRKKRQGDQQSSAVWCRKTDDWVPKWGYVQGDLNERCKLPSAVREEPGRSTILLYFEVSRQLIRATLLRVNIGRSPSICQQGGSRQLAPRGWAEVINCNTGFKPQTPVNLHTVYMYIIVTECTNRQQNN